MAAALLIMLVGAVLCQIYMHCTYTAEAINNNLRPAGTPSESDAIVSGIRKIAMGQVMYIFGIYLVKANFLMFFYRLGDKVRRYKITWWVVAVFTLATGVVWIGTVPYRCVFASREYMATGKCTLQDGVQMRRAPILAASVLDAVSDTAIMVLPIATIWNVRLSRRKRLALSALFAMSLFTIAVIIVRASVFFHDKPRGRPRPINLSWTWFWTVMEFYVCEYLFSNPERKKKEGRVTETVYCTYSVYDCVLDVFSESVCSQGEHHDAERDGLAKDPDAETRGRRKYKFSEEEG